MAGLEWTNLVERYIKNGEEPALADPRMGEDPETYLKRLYNQHEEPAEARRALIAILSTAIREMDKSVIGRGLRLMTLIPHSEFAAILRTAFFVTRDMELCGPYGDISLQALRAMYAMQSTLDRSSEDRSLWEAMWFALLGHEKYGVPAFQGLRHLDVLKAIESLPLLLRQKNLPMMEMARIVRGLGRDASGAGKGLKNSLAKAVASLNERQLIGHKDCLQRAFGSELIDGAVKEARGIAKADIAKVFAPELDQPHPTPEFSRGPQFEALAEWLKERIPVKGVSLWLPDPQQETVLFVADKGCPGSVPKPNRIFRYGERATGRVAKDKESRHFDLEAVGCDVYNREAFVGENICGLYSVYAPVNRSGEPPLSLVVNFFDSSVTALMEVQVQEACDEISMIAAEVCHQWLTADTDRRVAGLAAELKGCPTGLDVAATLVVYLRRAIDKNQYVALYVYHSDLRRLVLYSSYGPHDARVRMQEEAPVSFKVPKKLVKFGSTDTSPLRLPDLSKTSELEGYFPDVETITRSFGLDEIPPGQRIDFMAMPLCEPGLLVGLVAMCRIVDVESGTVYTPIQEQVSVELSQAATLPLWRATIDERRVASSTGRYAEQMLNWIDFDKGVAQLQSEAEEVFRDEAGSIFESWRRSLECTGSFTSFRTFRDRCQPFWHSGAQATKKEQVIGGDEKSARRKLQVALLDIGQKKLAGEIAVPVDSKLIEKLGIRENQKSLQSPNLAEALLALNILLVPLFNDERLDGMIGLEFHNQREVLKAADWLRSKEADVLSVRSSLLRFWEEHRQYLRNMFAALIMRWLKSAEQAGLIPDMRVFVDFLTDNRADPTPIELAPSLRMLNIALGGEYFEAHSDLKDEFDALSILLPHNRIAFNNPGELPQKLIAKSSWVRTVLATATTAGFSGGSAVLSLKKSKLPNRNYLDIAVSPNGHKDLGGQGLALAKAICRYMGWDCNYKDEKYKGVTMHLPVDNSSVLIPR